MQQAALGFEKLLVNSLRQKPAHEAAVLAWPLVCGSAVAERTRAVSCVGGVLNVEVPDAGWKRELQNLAAQYVAMLNRYSGRPVSRVEFLIPSVLN